MHALMHQVLELGAHEPKTMKDGLISNYNNLVTSGCVFLRLAKQASVYRNTHIPSEVLMPERRYILSITSATSNVRDVEYSKMVEKG